MKKKILSGIATLAIATAIAFNVSMNMSETNQLSDLDMAGVEALAQGEMKEVELPEVVISCDSDCDSGSGQCWKVDHKTCSCQFHGGMWNYCTCYE